MDFVGLGFVTVCENPEIRSTLTVFTITNPTPEPASLFLIGLSVTVWQSNSKRHPESAQTFDPAGLRHNRLLRVRADWAVSRALLHA